MENEVDYVPFGPEWEKEMMKFNKKYLIDWIRRLLINVHNIDNPNIELDEEKTA